MRDINTALQEHKNKVLEHFNENQVLGIFLYGSQNYNFSIDDSDIDTHVIIVPTFKQLCLDNPITKEYKLENGEHCSVKDIREMVKMFRKQNINFLEILFTEYYWVNSNYESLWNRCFRSMGETITHYDVNKAVQSISGQITHTVKQDPLDGKKIANGYRLAWFLKKYLLGHSFLDCIQLNNNERSFLLELKSMEGVPLKYHTEILNMIQPYKERWYEKNFEQQKRIDDDLNNSIQLIIRHLDNKFYEYIK